MTRSKLCFTTYFTLLLLAAAGGPAFGQSPHTLRRPLAANIIVPQTRSFTLGHHPPVRITEVAADVRILEQVATTTLDISLRNPSHRRQEAELIVPVPDDAVVRGFTFQGAASEPTARILPKDEARRIYDEIVARVRDPALLEFVGYNLVRSSVFPVEASGTQKVRLIYENLLPADGDRIDYLLPRSESLQYRVPWKVSVTIKAKRPISTVYSPSHKLETTRSSPYEVCVRIASDARTEPGAFRLSYLLEHNGVTASLLAYPDPKVGGGYFLLLVGLPAEPPHRGDEPAIKREVTLVIDRSGSMNGEKITQVREAANQVIAGLEPTETFNIIIYNEVTELFSNSAVLKTETNIRNARDFLNQMTARGGTNIHDALLEALRLKPKEGFLPIVLFLTDGLPTFGQTSEVTIRNLAIKGNPHHKRVFTFGVGVDVNAPLLERIALETRATPEIVLPGEDVEVKVARVFERLTGPVLADTTLVVNPSSARPRVRDLMPDKLPDLFKGDQLVLLGQYLGQDPLTFEISGSYLGRQRRFNFTFGVDQATTRNNFVPRLWASRKIAFLVDAIRQLGADPDPLATTTMASTDARVKELVEEIVRLSTEFGILTEYTAFLAREGTDLSRRGRLITESFGRVKLRAMQTRSGLGGANQTLNLGDMSRGGRLNVANRFYDQNMNRVEVTTVQQVSDRAFFNRGGRWVDSRIVNEENRIQPRRTIEFGSDEFRQLAYKLAREGRQGSIALGGDILMVVDNEPILVKGPGQTTNHHKATMKEIEQ